MWSHFNCIKNVEKLQEIERQLEERRREEQRGEKRKGDKIQYVQSIQYNPGKTMFAQTKEVIKAIGGWTK